MKRHFLCVECLMKRHFEKAATIEKESDRLAYILEAMRLLSVDSDEPAPIFSARCRELEDRYLGMTEKYSAIKKHYNALMLDMEADIARRIAQSDDPLRTAMLYARAGNYIDFGSEKTFEPELFNEILDNAVNDPLDEETYSRFITDMDRAESMLYIADNCGEIVLDKLLMIELHKRWPDVKMTFMVRGAPILNDVTREDAEQVGLDKLFEVVDNGTATPGTWIPSLPEATLELLNTADVILSKGQANIETLGGCGLNIYYLFMCKCKRVAKLLDCENMTGQFLRDRSFSIENPIVGALE